jgi:hypothetical protein
MDAGTQPPKRLKFVAFEDLDPKDWGFITMPDGALIPGSNGKPAIVSRRLTIKEKFQFSSSFPMIKVNPVRRISS